MAATLTHAELTKAVNHIFLPPKLPDQEDEECGDVLIRLTADALKALRSLVTLPQSQAAIEKAIHVVLSLRTIHDNSGVNEVDLRNAVATLKDEKTIAVNVSAQNAAVLVTRKQDQLMFEQFELSPRNEAVLAAKGRLVRSFPSAAVAIRSEMLDEADCAPTIARTIATMANQSVAAMQPRTRKAGAAHYEDRDTTDPAIVSELFFGALQGIGNSTLCKCSRISKKTREEVLWKDARRPWRRSPIWLLIRVALQLTISRDMDDSHVLYKKAMCFLMSHALERVLKLDTIIDSDLLYIMNAKIDRRRQKLLKMGETLHDPVGLRISTATRTCNDALSVRWSDIQKGDVRPVPLSELASPDFERDSLVRLPDLDDHIQRLRLDVSGLTVMKSYHALAGQFYDGNPEGISLMLFTILQLWVACDKAGIRKCDLIGDYSIQVPVDALQALLLPRSEQMRQLSEIEHYIASREANYDFSVMFDITSNHSFAARYFDASEYLQQLRQTIQAAAEISEQAKQREFKQTKQEYARLTGLFQETYCEYKTEIVETPKDDAGPKIVTYHGKALDKCEMKDICLQNGLKYRYYDAISSSYVGDYGSSDDLALRCIYSLPRESKKLQRFLIRRALAPDVEEYQELCLLPLGRHVQWANIILQLAMPGTDLKKSETTLTIMQCINQCGPRSLDVSVYRQAHWILCDNSSVIWILQNLQTALKRVQENWESVQAVGCFVSIATRVLSLSGSAQGAYLAFLSESCTVVTRWMQMVRNKSQEARSNEDRSTLAAKGAELALVCAATFELDDKLLHLVLQRSEHASQLIFASIMVQEGHHVQSVRQSTHVSMRYLRFQRTMHRSYELLAQNRAAIDLAVRQAWPGYVAGPDGWRRSSTADYWIMSSTSASIGRMTIQLNLLDGLLLVKGQALRQLPAHYLETTLFRALFGEAIMEVMPASTPGFEFSMLFDGNIVQLGMSCGNLIVQAMKDGAVFEAVPTGVLRHTLSSHFVNDYVLWYNTESDMAELRPLKAPWKSQPARNWIFRRAETTGCWQASKDGVSLLATKSRTAKVLSEILRPLATDSHIHYFRQTDGSLLVDVSGLRIGFTLAKNSSKLKSREYPAMLVDEDQTLGTLIGFCNKLILTSILHSKAVESFDQLSQADVDMLGNILLLSSQRSFYPAHERVMEQVDWDDQLGFLAQHEGFAAASIRLLQICASAQIYFTEANLQIPNVQRCSNWQYLSERHSIRVAGYRVAGFGAEGHTISEDVLYAARDSGSAKSRAIARVSSHFCRNGDALYRKPPTLQRVCDLMQSLEIRCGNRKFAVMLWISTLAFADDADLVVLQLLATLFKSLSLSGITPPPATSFRPKDGWEVSEHHVRVLVTYHQRPFEDCPEHRLPREQDEPKRRYLDRRLSTYLWNKNEVIELITNWFVAQGSCIESLIAELRRSCGESVYEHEYLSDLEHSLQALKLKHGYETSQVETTPKSMEAHAAQCKAHVRQIYASLLAAVNATAGFSTAAEVQQSPRLSPVSFLKQLTRNHWPKLDMGWKRCIVQYGLARTTLQRAERLSKLVTNEAHKDDLLRELGNPGHENWDPMQYPESLLIEIESGILIRERQERIAQEMRDPTTGLNSIMQLNMGEGKSSVIVPVVATALADGSQLVRVVVGKPKSKQMAQMLISKLGGIVGRRIYHLPFSRSVTLDSAAAHGVCEMLRECMNTRGVLLVQPEHILSFKLMGPECFIRKKQTLGNNVLAAQDFLERHARDIVDESDENFSTRFELIYTMGGRRSVELTPHRWLIIQELLGLVRRFAPAVAEAGVGSVEIANSGITGCFPRTRLLRLEAGELLATMIADHICKYGLDTFQLGRLPSAGRSAVVAYITKAKLSSREITAVENSTFWSPETGSQLLLLRGLLADGILHFVLARKRFRVDYGRATRTPPTRLAVPYRAKDNPTPRSEFSHPDVVISLTLLTYYYQGLSDGELFASLEHLMNSDQAGIHYQHWVQDSRNLPITFRQLSGINLRDRPQCVERLFRGLRHGKSVIDYYLAHYVFPQEMSEYPHKMSASGWDIGKQRKRLTTGFSGTNDSRRLLPFGAEFLDLPKQKHTNALVLENLLRDENDVHLMPPIPTATTDADYLLSVAIRLQPAVQVILDVGAQVLELTNFEVAWEWLKRDCGRHEAVIFVDDNNEICVVDRKGRLKHLQRSSYQGRMEMCLVFLDEAHTRGIDLRLPSNYRAAVTLGANLTKDRLVQACMRLRKLGKGQSVVFCIPEEIQTKILKATSKAVVSDIGVVDVLAWSISETHAETRRNMPLWAVQGERFVRNEKLWKAAQNSKGETVLNKTHASKFLEDEAQRLEHRYRPRHTESYPMLDTSDPDLQRIAARCQAFDGLNFNSMPKPPSAQPATHKLHPDVQKFAMTGELVAGSEAWTLVFPTVKETSAGQMFGLSRLKSGRHLQATVDFATTVEKSGGHFLLDRFLRPVQWVLRCFVPDTDVVESVLCISPFEANQLVEQMRASTATSLCIYKARVNSGYDPIDKLDFFNVSARPNPPILPRSLAVQLNLFAGQLYISSFEDYRATCVYLGIAWQEWSKEMEDQGWNISNDGFVLSDDKGRKGAGTKLTKSSAPFFKSFLSMRHNGEGISKTHMGRLLGGELFQASDFDV
ncbi:Protein of unknown function (DUF3645) [Teratosphaeria destructans]|uniref:ubiquitinyl hydrolase 1 n=1 Tax=Teratosphaeria destructans TaxID=418781 RepID=A0A9W7T3B1_9PEZI|nr:Protein of unknown function (DUF3645) [Teratosphaeria destructans]